MPEGYSRSFGCAQDDSLFSSRPGRPYVFLASRIVPGDNPPAMRCPRLFLFLLLFLLLPLGSARASEPFFKKGDVIALVGGEDMVVASEYGYLELLLTRALPDYHLRFRNLAWEGDTVFEQRRDLGFPTWEEQLDKIGATVVIAQFGQMESLAAAQEPRRRGGAEGGKEAVTEFIAAYEKLIERFSGGGKRLVIAVLPPALEVAQSSSNESVAAQNKVMDSYRDAIVEIARVRGLGYIPTSPASSSLTQEVRTQARTRDGVHLTERAHRSVAAMSVGRVVFGKGLTMENAAPQILGTDVEKADVRAVLEKIIAKNRLWFDYWRPQNWAFLAGDRTAQPSSRDHLDPSKRWFPPEREAFLPLIEAKEKEIDALAAQLAAGK